MTATLTTPALARRALKLPPRGIPATMSCTCVCCGASISPSDPVTRWKPSDGFMDGRALLHNDGKPVLCGDCAVFFSKTIMMRVMRTVITEEGVFPIVKGEHRAWFILNPPTPPFAVVFSNAKLQHLLWRAPLTQDADHWLIQMGGRTLTMNRQRVLSADNTCKKIGAAFLAKNKKQLRSPFVSLDPELSDMGTGVIRPDVRRFLLSQGMTTELAQIEALSPGDLWGLNAVIYRGGIATQPEPVRPPSGSADRPE